MALTLADAISKFGKSAKAKLQNPTASGEPEEPSAHSERSPVLACTLRSQLGSQCGAVQ